jgi:hypothetical protein
MIAIITKTCKNIEPTSKADTQKQNKKQTYQLRKLSSHKDEQ